MLPKPIPAVRGIPDWVKRMPMTAPAPVLSQDIQTVKQCPPFIDALSAGFLMPLACDVHVKDGVFDWDWPDFPASLPHHTARSPLAAHMPEQVTGSPLFDADRLFIKFVNFWTIALPAGWSLLCTHPVNRLDLPFISFTGLVDADLYADNYTHFPAVWTDPDFEGVLPKGTPVAQCIPVPRTGLSLDLEFGVLEGDVDRKLAETVRDVRTDEGKYKKKYRAKKR